MKEMKVKSEYRVHHDIYYLEKNFKNAINGKFIVSLGYDYLDAQGGQRALVLKIWDFISLDSK